MNKSENTGDSQGTNRKKGQKETTNEI